MFAECGWDVVALSAPIGDVKELKLTSHENIRVKQIAARSSHIVSKKDLATYCSRAVALARRFKPALIYASDPLGGLAGYFSQKACGARMIYHEHDSPPGPRIGKVIAWSRKLATSAASIIVFPNAQRAEVAQGLIGFDPAKLFIIWNLPRLAELPNLVPRAKGSTTLYYHGSISPNRLPETIFAAAAALTEKIRVTILGYEAPSAKGYVNYLLEKWGAKLAIEYSGTASRPQVLRAASQADIGLSFVPLNSSDINTRYMLGASVKSFDYMACGLPQLVSAQPDWQDAFVKPGYAVACDPSSADSIAGALKTLLASAELRAEMGQRARNKICSDWNFDKAWMGLREALSF